MTLEPMGGAIDAKEMVAGLPYLLNLHEDFSLTKNLAYPILRFSIFGVEPGSTPPPPFTLKGDESDLILEVAQYSYSPRVF